MKALELLLLLDIMEMDQIRLETQEEEEKQEEAAQ